ncbi:tRNA lysidine(34) synthetase TilS [Rhodocaloribacter litoris]|uniref:tRNA lysidine(34) synthetase TilS n=1 Tax=Rhodocaloribacter litoris TaxID=2558931 RepID=UPI001E49C1D6|nr:tRNA lysidine(34) synthetase TilS [Rhodocaloribacter litoris]QXD15713.1 tRNA lysidine(34) synthetase TilS [Rhodocaloribacter litoris]GIV60213.1 MAG: tRNA(Ile)-lysidine synthase [Rhodothermaceae bacterium]
MSLREQVAAFIARHRLLEPGERVLAGVSGGVDSMTLLDVLHRLGYPVVVAHVNYGLRGAASEADERLVREACARYGVPLHVHRPATRAAARAAGQSLQEAARDLRYAFFDEVAAAEGLTRVAVGHHRDDQAETVLLNLFRGAGLEGLAGMAPARPLRPEGPRRVIRPLLGVPRAAIEAYARAEGLRWREDPSNADPRYRRGRLRAEIMPRLREHFGPAAIDQVARTAEMVRDYLAHAIEPAVSSLFEAAGRATTRGGRLELDVLHPLPAVWRRRLLLEALARWLPGAPYRASVAEAVEALIEAQVGRRVVLSGGTVWRERTALFFTRHREKRAGETATTPAWLLRKPGDALVFDDGILRAEPLPERPGDLTGTGRFCEIVDADRLTFPLAVRFWHAGDRLRPLGMQGRQKVSDLLTQAKVPPHARARVRVVCSGEEIVWVVGHRLAETVRVRDATRRFLRLSFTSLRPEEDVADR